MAASRSDSYFLGTNVLFQHRVQEALIAACLAIASEGNIANHTARLALVHQVLASQSTLADKVTLFSFAAATDSLVLADATVAGTVIITAVNSDAQQALATDAHIDGAITSQFNAFAQGMLI